MALKVGELYAVMRMDDAQFRQGIDQSKGRFEGLKSAIGTGVKTIATAFAASTTAVAGLGVAALRVGLDYNRMQQSSRAALTTLLGSAEAANAQMDKLDEFARTSPFAKQVFIQAQQQLIGFGMAADDVLPTLDAIQNAVAAVGGSNDDIAEVTRILAVVQSSGKITAETLNQLGVRGIDAATLIGESMGMTGQEIRESITKGSLDAGDAIEALTEGMIRRFGGATDNIKQQMDGAADRVKGAFRDIGSAIAAPFIDPKGGGLAVQWTNDLADGMRNFEAKLKPLVSLLVDRFGPGLAQVSPLIQSAGDAINAWDLGKVNGQLDRLGRYTPIISGVATAMFSLGTQSIPIIGAINPLVAGFAALAATSPEIRSMFSDAASSVAPLVPLFGHLAVTVSHVALEVISRLAPAFTDLLVAGGDLAVTLGSALLPAVGNLALASLPLVDMLAGIVGWVSELPGPLLAAVTAFLLLQGPLRPIAEGLAGVAQAFQRVFQQAKVQAALGETNIAMGGLASASIRASAGIGAVGTALKTAFMGNALLLAVSGIVAAFGAFATSQAEAKRGAEEFRTTLDQTTGAITEQTEAMIANRLESSGAAEAWVRMGGDLADLMGHITGNAEATARYNDLIAANTTLVGNGKDSWNEYSTEASTVISAVGGITDELEIAEGAQARMNEMTGQGAGANRDAADAADEHRRAQKALYDQLNEGIDATLSAAEAALRVADAQAASEDAVRRKIEADRELEEVLASSTATEDERAEATRRAEQAGRDAERQSLSYTRAVDDHIAAIGRNNGSYGEMRAEMARARESFIVQREQMGMTRAEAEKLADEYGLIPSRVDTMVHLSGVQAALDAIGSLDRTLNRINGKTATAYVTVRQYGQAAIASGGYVGDFAAALGYAAGGAPRRFPAGGHVLGPGTPTSDSIPAWLSTTEFVQQAAAVRKYGLGFMHSVNSLRFPAELARPFAVGGSPAETSPRYMAVSGATVARLHPDDLAALGARMEAAVERGAERGTERGFQAELEDGLMAQRAGVW